MSVLADGFLDWADRLPGIPDKVYSEPNRGLGLIGHSIVGTPAAALGRFMSTQKDAAGNYTGYAAASVMFINPKVGPLTQMYPVWASTWTSGGRQANTSLWAIETEGGAPGNESEPLNDNQVGNLLRLADDFEQHTGRKVTRSAGGGLHEGDTFREHGEVAQQYGYSGTACPSHRYQRFYDALAKGDLMTEDQINALIDKRIKDKLYNSQLVDSAQIPSLVAQIVGADESTFSPGTPAAAKVAQVRGFFARLGGKA